MVNDQEKRIFIAGHAGMVGSAIKRQLENDANNKIITASKSDLDLTNQRDVLEFIETYRPDSIYIAAAKVGGIYANNEYPAEFIYQNLMIQTNIVHSAHLSNINKLLFLGSSCIYPREAEQPIKESSLLDGKLEPTNEPYAVAKIAGIKLCESYNRQYRRDYRSVMPTNLYGPGDNFHAETSHVIPALMRRFHLAKLSQEGNYEALDIHERINGQISNLELINLALTRNDQGRITSHPSTILRPKVVVWGSGVPRREFLYVDDMASASIHVMDLDREAYQTCTEPMLSHINVGSGLDCTIKDLAETMASVVGFDGKVEFDSTKPDGAPKKLLNVTRLKKLGWKAQVPLQPGIEFTYKWFVEQQYGTYS